MKKYIFTLLLAVLIAQSYGQKVLGGLTVSPVLSWMKPTISENVEFDKVRMGINFGILGDFHLSNNFAFSTAITINNYGGRVSYSDSIPEFEVSLGTTDSIYSLPANTNIAYKLQFIEIPIALKLKTNEIGAMTYFLKFGFNPGFKWRAKGDADVEGISDKSIQKEVAFLNLGIIASGGFEYSFGGNAKLLTEVNFANGFTDLTSTKLWDRKSSSVFEKSDKVILSNIALTVGLLFEL